MLWRIVAMVVLNMKRLFRKQSNIPEYPSRVVIDEYTVKYGRVYYPNLERENNEKSVCSTKK